MRIRLSALTTLLVILASWTGLAAAAKLDDDDKDWLEGVMPIMLEDEQKAYKDLDDKSDRMEFRKIFWARRDPSLSTPENEYQPEYEAARDKANEEYRVTGRPGSHTDCGRIFILLGEPDDTQVRVGSVSVLSRVPEVWIYKSKEGGRTFEGGEARIAFDGNCRAPGGIQGVIESIAAELVVQPQLEYRAGEDGRLVTLEDQLPKPTPARLLLESPRQDFPITVDTRFMRAPEEMTGVVGLLRGQAADLPTEERDGGRFAPVVVVTRAVAEDGTDIWTEQPARAEVQPDGSFVASYGTGLSPGSYTLSVGALIGEDGAQGALVSEKVVVPSFTKVETAADGSTQKVTSVASILFVRDVRDLPRDAEPDPEHPYAAFRLGASQFVPYFGRELSPSDAVTFFSLVYDLAVKPGTEESDAVAAFSILKGGRTPVAKAPPNPIKTPMGMSSVGPVPLERYPPGSYVAQLKVTDNISKKTTVRNERFKIVAPEGSAP